MRSYKEAGVSVVPTTALDLKAKFFRGFADPSRLAIVEVLRDGEQSVSEIVMHTGLSQPNVSAHLACLKDCGLVANRQEGRRVFYRLADPRMEEVLRTAEAVLADVAANVYACTRYRADGDDLG
jgi:ArsR family transcriptional regulator, cadmium/lead-responsive transcriptional repressor